MVYIGFEVLEMSSKSLSARNTVVLFLCIVCFVLLTSISVFARPNTVCSGKEFNKRIKTMVDGGDVAVDNRITRFERGNTPPSDSDYYVDISEDNDESVIAYYTVTNPTEKGMKKVNLYWYATDNIFMNENTALMFQGLSNISYIDLTGFSYFEGLNDVRYMFKDCRNLKYLHFKPTGYNPAAGNTFTPTEMQGMFFGCQSLRSVDLTYFNTYLVSNMADLFCKCYNLINIYVNKQNWDISNVYNFNNMFTECHLLRSTTGKKAVDISDDDYEKFAAVAVNGVDSFIKDENSEYTQYIKDDEYVPIDGQGYLMNIPESMEEYGDEPEEDGDGSDYAQNNAGLRTDETGMVVNTPTSAQSQLSSDTSQSQSYLQNNTVESSVVSETNTNESIDENLSVETSEAEGSDTNETVQEGTGTRIIEIDEYLDGEGKSNKNDKNIIEELWDDYQPLVIALLISIFVLLLLIGMVLYLYKENKQSKDSSSKF